MGKWLSVGEIGFHESDLPNFFFLSYIFRADLLLIKVLAGQSFPMLCICFFSLECFKISRCFVSLIPTGGETQAIWIPMHCGEGFAVCWLPCPGSSSLQAPRSGRAAPDGGRKADPARILPKRSKRANSPGRRKMVLDQLDGSPALSHSSHLSKIKSQMRTVGGQDQLETKGC